MAHDLWNEWHTHRANRHKSAQALLQIMKGYLNAQKNLIDELKKTLASAERVPSIGPHTFNESSECEKNLTAALRACLMQCRHHPHLCIKNAFREHEREALNSEMHMARLKPGLEMRTRRRL